MNTLVRQNNPTDQKAFADLQAAEQIALYQALPPKVRELYDKMREIGFNPLISETQNVDGTITKASLMACGYPVSSHGELLVPVEFVWKFIGEADREVLLERAGVPKHRLNEFAGKSWKQIKLEGRVRLYNEICGAVLDYILEGEL